ncbi:DUF4747 family protein [Ramlibacter sp. PS3R-8]|uniref:DUF4747 family protein n=1 Tax=Ramlibacter sp. PS3R-8 TaxID=3133437 RepID=UPI00309BCF23
MSKFIVFNIQLLPVDRAAESEEVGPDGYLQLFWHLNEQVKKVLAAKALMLTAFRLVQDSYFAPLPATPVTAVENGADGELFVLGAFIKFDKTSSVEDLYTRVTLFEQQEGQEGISGRREYPFIFNPRAHWLAVDTQSGRLPSIKNLEKALNHFLKGIADEHFPHHVLTINLVSKKDELVSVLERAVGFKKIEVDLTFKNGPTSDEVLDDFAENRLHRLHLRATTERGGVMPHVPQTIDGIVRNAAGYGRASITFVESVDGKNVTTSFQTENAPETVGGRQQRNEDTTGFFRRMNSRLLELARKVGHLGD